MFFNGFSIENLHEDTYSVLSQVNLPSSEMLDRIEENARYLRSKKRMKMKRMREIIRRREQRRIWGI